MRLQLPCLRTSHPRQHRSVRRSASMGVLQSRRSGTSRGSRGPPQVHRCLLSAYVNRYPVSHVPIVELGMWQTSRCSIPYALIVGEHPNLLQAYDVVLRIRERCSNRIDALPPILAHKLEPPAVEREHAQLAVRVRHLCTSTRWVRAPTCPRCSCPPRSSQHKRPTAPCRPPSHQAGPSPGASASPSASSRPASNEPTDLPQHRDCEPRRRWIRARLLFGVRLGHTRDRRAKVLSPGLDLDMERHRVTRC